ncbi:hypothetical protein EAG_00801 [Camponotus floridanus]|uniref:Uncharacterized protein n=1 Tax=Camponotus floridanus TaxID=104421 RepID=E2AQN4_CAMFO|nr:hypothetical protein EAG_00801 [Camponotus floridanus]
MLNQEFIFVEFSDDSLTRSALADLAIGILLNFCCQSAVGLCLQILLAEPKLNTDAVDANLPQYSVSNCTMKVQMKVHPLHVLGNLRKETANQTKAIGLKFELQSFSQAIHIL